MKALTAALASAVLLFCFAPHACAWQGIPDPMIGEAQPATTSPDSLNDYMNDGGEPISIPQLGIRVRNGSARLDSDGLVSGAAVTEVSAKGGSAGILEDHHTSHMIVTGALIGAGAAAAVMFPPAIFAVVMIAHARSSAEALDLIIAVDGNRVRNTLDLIEAVEDAHKG